MVTESTRKDFTVLKFVDGECALRSYESGSDHQDALRSSLFIGGMLDAFCATQQNVLLSPPEPHRGLTRVIAERFESDSRWNYMVVAESGGERRFYEVGWDRISIH